MVELNTAVSLEEARAGELRITVRELETRDTQAKTFIEHGN